MSDDDAVDDDVLYLDTDEHLEDFNEGISGEDSLTVKVAIDRVRRFVSAVRHSSMLQQAITNSLAMIEATASNPQQQSPVAGNAQPDAIKKHNAMAIETAEPPAGHRLRDYSAVFSEASTRERFTEHP
mgnify:CR=1 FL=1